MGYLVVQQGGGSNAQGSQAVFTNNNATAGTPGTDPSDPPLNRREFGWLPYDTQLKSLTVHLTVAPGSGKTANYRVHKDSNGNVSPILQILGAVSQDLSAVVEEPIPGLDVTSDTTIRDTIHYLTTWPSTSGNAAGARFMAYEYMDDAHPELTYFITHVGEVAASFGAADQYASIVDPAITTAATIQSLKQCPMPVDGTIRHAFAIWRGYTNTTTVEAALQVGTFGGGVDSAIVFTMQGAGGGATIYQATIDAATEVTIAEGDFVNWRLARTAGAATSGFFCLGFGYAAGV